MDDPMTEIVFGDDEGTTFDAPEPEADEQFPDSAGTGEPYDDVLADDPGYYEPTTRAVFDEPMAIEGEIWPTSQDASPEPPYDVVVAGGDVAPPTPRPSETTTSPEVSVFDVPEHIADKLWRPGGQPKERVSPYESAVNAARVLAPSRPPLRVIQGGRGTAIGPRAGLPAAGAAGALLGFAGLVAGLGYVAARQGQTFEERTRRRIFGQSLLDDGLIDLEEFEEYVRSGNLPERVARAAAIKIMTARGDVDLWNVRTRGVTATGQPRDAPTFWQLYVKQKGNLGLSAENIARIKQGRSPRVDKTWVRTYPEHDGFEGRRLDHHHIEGTSIATPIPDLLHHWLYLALHPYRGRGQGP
jgi:hypothetical protein